MSDNDYPSGSPMNPQQVGKRHIVQFAYAPGHYFEAQLTDDGRLEVRVGGHGHSDLMAFHAHVANAGFIVARRWNQVLERHIDLVDAPKVKA